LIILPDTSCDEGLVLAKRLLDLVRNHKFHTSKGVLQITISIGISQYIMGESMGSFIDRVDKLLYEAKNSGRDCIKVCK
ncbi:MAG TPA: diguanylate cyclase, partial [Spirochaetota bacterium]|nr:diguanylate cyclase [Spirochaetota bacterium]